MSDYIFCSQCGNKCDSNSRFCNSCGSQLIMPGDKVEESEMIQEESVAERVLHECNMNKIEAIKKYKDLTGKSLKESKADIYAIKGNGKGFFQQIRETTNATLKYYGSCPLFPKECKMNLKVDTTNLKFGTLLKQEIVPLSDVKNVKIETEKEIVERLTATRIALFGPFALAFKKRKVNKTKYMVIECENYVLTFEGDSFSARTFCERLYKNMLNNKI